MGKIVGTMAKAELDALQERAKRVEELEKQLESIRNGNDPEKEKLQKELEELRKKQQQAQFEAAKGGLVNYLQQEAERLNDEKFESRFGPAAMKEILEAAQASITEDNLKLVIEDTVDGEETVKRELKTKLFQIMEQKAKIIEEAEAQRFRSSVAAGMDVATRFNTLSNLQNRRGQLNEQAYGTDARAKGREARVKFRDWILAEALGRPVYDHNGRFILEPYMFQLDKVIKQQNLYETSFGKSEGHWFSPGGPVYEIFNAPKMRENLARMLFEADEITTTSIVGGNTISQLPLDISAAMIMATWPQLLALRVAATSGTMQSNTIRIYERAYPRADDETMRAGRHFFGFVASDNQTTLQTSGSLADGTDASDDGPLSRASGHIPQDVYAYVGEKVDADTTITITGTNAAGQSATATVTILATDPVGTIKKFTPTVLGDTFVDVSAVTSSGWTNGAGNGQVGIFTEEPYSAHQPGQPAQKAKYKLKPYDLREEQYDIQSNMTLAAIEDMQIAMAAGESRGIDLEAQMMQTLGNDLRDYIDRKVLDKCYENAYAGNKLTFEANIPADGYVDSAWKERLHFYHDQLSTQILTNSGARPNWVIWSEYDRPHFVEWLSQSNKLSKFDANVNDPFNQAQAGWKIVGSTVYASENARVEHVLMGSNSQRTGVHYYVYVPFKLLQALNPTAGMETVVFLHHRAAIDVVNGRALGVLHVKRR